MSELEIFISTVYWHKSKEHDRKNKKKRENKLLVILDKTSNAACFKEDV